MPTIPTRRLGVALLAAAVVFTTGTALAADLTLTAPGGAVGAGQLLISAPCDSVAATYTINYRAVNGNYAYYIDAVVLAGTGCKGDSLTVKVRLNAGATNPETIYPVAVAGTAITAGLSVDVIGKNVMASDLAGIVVLITGS